MKVKLSVLFIIIVSFLTACRPYNLEHFAPVITSDKEKGVLWNSWRWQY